MKDRPNLYALARIKHVFGSCVWSPIFVQDAFVNDGILVIFLSKSNGIIVQDSSHDLVRWDLHSNGIFAVKFFYMKLVSLASSPSQ